MPRPTNAEVLKRTPDIEEGTEIAVNAFLNTYPNAKIIEAELAEEHDEHDEEGMFEVAGGWKDEETGEATIVTMQIAEDGTILKQSFRPNEPPGQLKQREEKHVEKLEKSRKERKEE